MSVPPGGATFSDIVDAVTAEHLERPAVVHDRASWTYAELAEKTKRVGSSLAGMGIGPEDHVAIVVDRTRPDWLIAILGAMCAGAGFVTLDPAHPDERLRFIIADSSPTVVLDGSKLASLPELPTSVSIHSLLADDYPQGRIRRAHVDNLAYVIYTSGSTGTPKGVSVTHAGMAALAATQASRIGTSPGDQVLQWASPSFDAAVWDITMALFHGATLHFTTAENLLPGEPLAETLRTRRITHATLPPAALSALPSDLELPDLTTIVSTGDSCTQGVVDRWAGRLRLINGYGPTETTVGASLSDPLVAGVPADIGTPFESAHIDLLDDDEERTDEGQIAISGPGVARGYHKRPRLTAEKFRPDPRSPGRRRYLSGDMARVDRQGRLYFVGRVDRQIKLRGNRIELGEIEQAVAAHPAVTAAAVEVRRLADSDQIVTWFSADGQVSVSSIRDHIAAMLPSVMVPAAYIQLDHLPVTVNGKIDRDSLSIPDEDVARITDVDDSDLDLVSWLQSAFGRQLNIADVAADDNFFALGGDSIQYTKLLTRLRHERNTRLPIKEALAAANPRSLAALGKLSSGGGHSARL